MYITALAIARMCGKYAQDQVQRGSDGQAVFALDMDLSEVHPEAQQCVGVWDRLVLGLTNLTTGLGIHVSATLIGVSDTPARSIR